MYPPRGAFEPRASAPARPVWTRRRLLAFAGATGLALSGCSSSTGTARDPVEGAFCVGRSSLVQHSSLAALPLGYEVSQQPSSFWFDAGFYSQLQAWLTAYADQVTERPPDQIWTYGAWISGGTQCDSWHHSGRAFDLSRLRLASGQFLSARYDQWRTTSGATLERHLRDYWSLAASLHQHFAYVLTYLYNPQHHNHLHIDNGRSGTEPSAFSSRSRVQVQAVQGVLTYLWDRPVEPTGAWDGPTRRAVRQVLDELEITTDLRTGSRSWQPFLQASTARGAA
jgi:hypothetical protein